MEEGMEDPDMEGPDMADSAEGMEEDMEVDLDLAEDMEDLAEDMEDSAEGTEADTEADSVEDTVEGMDAHTVDSSKLNMIFKISICWLTGLK